MLFIVIQIFFVVVVSFVSLDAAKNIWDLQPFNSSDMTVRVRFSQPETINGLKAVAQKERLNIALLDEENNSYYVYFSDSTNPLFVVDKFEQIDNVTSIEVYPRDGQSLDAIKNIFATLDEKVRVTSDMISTDYSFLFIYVIFIVIDILVLLSVIQAMYERGKEVGIQRMLGRTFVVRALVPLLSIVSVIVPVLVIVYYVVYYYVTFDWAFLWPVFVYCCAVGVLWVLTLTYHQFNIQTRPINVLIKGLAANKILMTSYVIMSVVLLLVSGGMLPLVSHSIMDQIGQYKMLSYYESELKASGNIHLTDGAMTRAFEGDAFIIAKNNTLMEHLAPYLESKRQKHEFYYTDVNNDDKRNGQPNTSNLGEDLPIFSVFYVNKNFAINQIKDIPQTVDFADTNKVYVFVKSNEAQEKEMNALKNNPQLNRNVDIDLEEEAERSVEIIPYDNDNLQEYVQGFNKFDDIQTGKAEYQVISNPIYIVEGGEERFDAPYKPSLFAGVDGQGYYMPLKTEAQRRVWDEVPMLLQEIGADADYFERGTLWESKAKIIGKTIVMLYIFGSITVTCFIGSIGLIYAFLQAYFRNKRKELVINKIFGSTFLERYQVIFIVVSFVFVLAWMYGTYTEQEWSGINIALAMFAMIIMNGFILLQIKRLEKAAMHVVIKE